MYLSGVMKARLGGHINQIARQQLREEKVVKHPAQMIREYMIEMQSIQLIVYGTFIPWAISRYSSRMVP